MEKYYIACHTCCLSCARLFWSYLCIVVLVNETFTAANLQQTDCPCTINNTAVDCSIKDLTTIPSCIPANVTHLNLNNNDISHIEDFAFAGMQELSTLDMEGNYLTSITRRMFVNLTNIKSLNLYNNEISRIDDFAFAGMKNLTDLCIHDNYLTTITRRMFMNLTNLETLNVNSNRISKIDNYAFAGMQALSKLDISRNKLQAVTRGMFIDLTNLETFDLSYNSISHVEEFAFAGMLALSKLDLRKNSNLRTEEVICALDDNQRFILQNEEESSCQILNFRDCTISMQTNATSLLLDNSTFCSSMNGSLISVRCQQSVVNFTCRYGTPKRRPTTTTTTTAKATVVGISQSHERKVTDSTFMIVTSPNSEFIVYINVTSKTHKMVPLNALYIDYDPIENRFYWTSQYGTSIYSAFLNGTYKTIVGATNIDTKPRGIAVDSLSRLVFYSEENRGYIALITMSSFNHTVLINGLVQPGAIVLDVWDGLMCWIDSGTNRIECSNYDGSDRRDVVNTDLHNPIGLALDLIEKQIYWSNGNIMERCNLDGRDRTVVGFKPASAYSGLALFADKLYAVNTVTVAKTVKSFVYQYERDGRKQTEIFENSSLLYDIHIFSDSVHYTKGPNICGSTRHECSHICIPKKGNKSQCLCPDTLSLNTDEKTCVQKLTETAKTDVLVGSVITLLIAAVTVVAIVLIIRRRRLCLLKENQHLPLNEVNRLESDEGLVTNPSNECPEIYHEIMDA